MPIKPSIWANPWMIVAYVVAGIVLIVMPSLLVEDDTTPVAGSSPTATATQSTPVGPSKTTAKPSKKATGKPTKTKASKIPASATGPYRVIRVVDGDTVHVNYKGSDTTIRLIGVDTPETVAPGQPVECFGRQASKHTKALLDGHKVYLATDPSQDRRDRYGRLLAYLWLPSGKFVNLNLIRQGYAHEYTYDVAYKYQERFQAAERKARAKDRGLWSPKTCDGRSKPAKTSKPKTTEPPSDGGLDLRFDTCAEANDNGYGPYVKGVDPEYDWYRDADSDGIVCER